MPCFHKISFYHDCGHTEDVEYLRLGNMPTEYNLLPPGVQIDAFRPAEAKDKMELNNEVEVHYKMGKCCYCHSSLFPVFAQVPTIWRWWERSLHSAASPQVISHRRTLWREVADLPAFALAREVNNHNVALAMITNNKFALSALLDMYKKLISLRRKRQEKSVSAQSSSQLNSNGFQLWKEDKYLSWIENNLSGTIVIKLKLERNKRFYEGFFKYDLEDYRRRPNAKLDDRMHCLTPGWNAKLLTKVNATSRLDDDCAICYEALRTDQPRELPCKHIFHLDCIGNWLFDDNNGCPMCRKKYMIVRPPYNFPWSGHDTRLGMLDVGTILPHLRINQEKIEYWIEQTRLAVEREESNSEAGCSHVDEEDKRGISESVRLQELYSDIVPLYVNS